MLETSRWIGWRHAATQGTKQSQYFSRPIFSRHVFAAPYPSPMFSHHVFLYKKFPPCVSHLKFSRPISRVMCLRLHVSCPKFSSPISRIACPPLEISCPFSHVMCSPSPQLTPPSDKHGLMISLSNPSYVSLLLPALESKGDKSGHNTIYTY